MKKEPKRQKEVANSTQEEKKVAKPVKTLTKDQVEIVLNEQGKRIGKKDANGNFVPYKKRGRPGKNAATANSSNS